ncbi:hypothetical protein SEA_IBANTIK_95 [Streptomyces phage Ibantik]|uniref:Uncharacterized protein n=1 Tax=Streptomyces phage Ibantik TaxID=2182397 RepID=A0A2U8UNK8_9CAUD|nr:hypothetical protein QEH36_gp070 [Streptomyces phage Ibantik]AWN05317.1 hypothetical protein SEA_IBANTIK_95 [Streptomyces phage Ibantik]
MRIWIVTNNDCPTGGYESAWRTEEQAAEEAARLNTLRGRNRYWVDKDELQGEEL